VSKPELKRISDGIRRAALVGIISMLVSMAAAAYLSGLMSFQFLNALPGREPQQVLTDAVEQAGTFFLLSAALMVVGLAGAIIAARVILMGMGVRNPIRMLRGPLILCILGGILNVILSFPLIFIVMAIGLAWGAYRIFDECFNPVQIKPHLSGSGRGGGLDEFIN
jgi:hypothetical protein